MSSPGLQALLEEGVANQVFPAAQAAVRYRGDTVFEGAAGAARPTTHFDLASVTKLFSATLLVSLWARGKLAPEWPVSRFFPRAAAASLGPSLADLCFHRSGLPPFLPLFAEVLTRRPELLQKDCSAKARARGRSETVEAARQARPVSSPRQQVAYSDVGFILLGEILAELSGVPLDAAIRDQVTGPFELASHFRRLSRGEPPGISEYAPTGTVRPRPPAPGQEGMWGPFASVPSYPGEVDDDNAWAMDGVAGHAGLFGTAADLALFGQRILEEAKGKGRIAPRELWTQAFARDTRTPGSSRALGFDTASEGAGSAPSSAGRILGARKDRVVGHLGYVGTSLWIDLEHELVISLVTNRTFLGRANLAIRDFRPRFHDAVAAQLGLAGG